jgi:hypothetical protein
MPPDTPAADHKRDARRYKQYLRSLADATEAFLTRLDVLMRQPSTVERGREIARLCNALEMEKDRAWHFGLGLPFKRKRGRDAR